MQAPDGAGNKSTPSTEFPSTSTNTRPRWQRSIGPATKMQSHYAPAQCPSNIARGERLVGFEREDAHNRRTLPSTSKIPCLRPHGWWQEVYAGLPLDISAPASSSVLCVAKTAMSTVIDSVPARPRAISFGRVSLCHTQRRIESQQPRATFRNKPSPMALRPEDSVPNPSGMTRSFSGSLFRSVPFRTSARGRGQRAESVSRASFLPRLHPHSSWLPRNRIVMRKRTLYFSCFDLGCYSISSISPPHIHCTPQSSGRQSFGASMDLEMRQDGPERANSGHVLPPNITDSAGEPPRTRPQRLCIPTQRCSHRDHAVSFRAHPAAHTRTLTHPSLPQHLCAKIKAAIPSLPPNETPYHGPRSSAARSWLPLARQGAIRGKATAGAAFTMFHPFPWFVRSMPNEAAADTCPTRQTPLPTSRMSSIPPSPHKHTQKAMSPPHHGQPSQRSWIRAGLRRTRARQCLASISKS